VADNVTEPDYGPTLDEFMVAYEADDNEWWRLSCGEHQNLYEYAVERFEAAEATLARARELARRCNTPRGRKHCGPLLDLLAAGEHSEQENST
jgi:hypothetical protein